MSAAALTISVVALIFAMAAWGRTLRPTTMNLRIIEDQTNAANISRSSGRA